VVLLRLCKEEWFAVLLNALQRERSGSLYCVMYYRKEWFVALFMTF